MHPRRIVWKKTSVLRVTLGSARFAFLDYYWSSGIFGSIYFCNTDIPVCTYQVPRCVALLASLQICVFPLECCLLSCFLLFIYFLFLLFVPYFLSFVLFFFSYLEILKNWKTSAVSTTDWMVETPLCKLHDIYIRRRFVPCRLFRNGYYAVSLVSVATCSAYHMFAFLISCTRHYTSFILFFLRFFVFVDLDLDADLFHPAFFVRVLRRLIGFLLRPAQRIICFLSWFLAFYFEVFILLFFSSFHFFLSIWIWASICSILPFFLRVLCRLIGFLLRPVERIICFPSWFLAFYSSEASF